MHPVESCYTDYAIPAAKYWYTLWNFLCADTHVFDWLDACRTQTANQHDKLQYIPFYLG
jgi:hypothetical protein